VKAKLGAYTLWQLRDFFFERAVAILVILGLFIWAEYAQTGIARASTFVAEGGVHALQFGAAVMGALLAESWPLCALIAIYGISANDRTTGRFRLMFAKPASVVGYYARAFVVQGVAFMLCVAIGIAAFSRVFPLSGLAASSALVIYAVSYLLVGGVCFLFSAIWRFDWVSTGAVLGAALYLASRFPDSPWLGPLPPFWKISQQIDLIRTLDPLDPKPLLWVAAYGIACFLLGLIILKRRPLAT
jgi:hypothetical protein